MTTLSSVVAPTNIITENNTITLTNKTYNEKHNDVTSSANTVTLDCSTGNSFKHVLTEDTSVEFSNVPTTGTGFVCSLEIVQDAGASGFTVSWANGTIWPGASAPTLTATASATDVFVFNTIDGGTTWYGFTAGQGLATPV